MSLLKSLRKKKEQLFFGWWIVLGSYVIQVLNGALLFHAFSAYILPLQTEFGWSRASVSGVFSMVRAESGILGPLQGWLIERYGCKAMMQIGIVLFGIGYLCFSRIDSLWDFYLSFALIALGSSLGGFIPISTTITNWFARQRSTALGISMTGMGVGGLLISLVVWSLSHYGWRDTAFFSGVMIFCLGLPATLLIRDHPEHYGLRPDGDEAPATKPGDAPALEEPRFTTRQALRTPTFWFLSIGHSSALFVVGTVLVHQIPHMIEHVGLSPEVAAANVTLLLLFMIGGQLTGGWIGDRVNKRLVMVTCMWMHAVALVLFAFATSRFETTLFAAIHGTAWGVRGTLINAIRGDYFGRASYAMISGFASMIIMVGMVIGPLFAGFLHDLTGSYQQAFMVLAGFSALGSVALILARKPAAPGS
ncbi:MAG: MFS transporter [Candidatus Latescibacteria bacterium]|jgi:sugar phosphate permease|nr:MFS transporter [Candidatus Latescibacterota bacterium]|tara:strand:+ start:263 stop:1522 length:1260 start_codon:yes stop_codon:yes gene_type:complete